MISSTDPTGDTTEAANRGQGEASAEDSAECNEIGNRYLGVSRCLELWKQLPRKAIGIGAAGGR
jgi:hypothetical protein